MFSVSARTQYGIRALAYLARKPGWEAVCCEIAEAEEISPKYLEGILTRMTAAGLVRSERGKNGGYRLARNPRELVMADVVAALDGKVRPVDCVDSLGVCHHDASCLSRKFWMGLKDAIDRYLEEQTLSDICAEPPAGPELPVRRQEV
ncbi:MAG TPA: Rrf2 family transcriptional regulator [Magnetospirillaceae bacterium]|nr:Rrf2 family transcriptional regulator [Magnetospirillaceae bacterium]